MRKLLIGNSTMMDNKLEKNANYELNPPADNVYFACEIPKGTVNGGQEMICEIKFNPPELDPLLKDISALRGIGQWVESVWELKIQGGWVEAGESDNQVYDVVLRAYVEQI
jgi:hypothetical protein